MWNIAPNRCRQLIENRVRDPVHTRLVDLGKAILLSPFTVACVFHAYDYFKLRSRAYELMRINLIRTNLIRLSAERRVGNQQKRTRYEEMADRWPVAVLSTQKDFV